MRRLLLAAIGTVLVVMACDNKSGPPPPPPPVPTVKALTINGRARVAPGETEQYEAIAQFTDGTTQVYTSRVQWFGGNSFVASLANNGLLTARTAGEIFISANFGVIRSTLNVMVIPAGTFRLTGTVSESNLPVAAATVKVTSGVGAGLSGTTDSLGQYRIYGVSGPIEVEVSRPGYTTVTRSFNVHTDDLLDVPDFAQTNAPPSVAGTYTLTISIADGCSVYPRNAQFPAEAKTRSYTAVVTQNGPHLAVALSGANFIIQGGKGNAFEGRVEPNQITFSLHSAGTYAYYYFYYGVGTPDLAERLSTSDGLSFLGTASTKQTPAGLVGELNGTAMLFSATITPPPSVRMQCVSAHHPFSLTPQTAGTRRRR